MNSTPLVSVVTPVYNGGKYLDDCIRSVRSQTYAHIEHVILDNASTDDTGLIAAAHAARDPRIKVFRNPSTVPVIENWNLANAQMSAASAYCKTLHADDMLYPDCIERMVDLAERNPGVGVIGALRHRGTAIQCDGLPKGKEVFSGTKVARLFLRGEVFAFAPTSGMVRTALMRNRGAFFPPGYLHADLAAYFSILDRTDFGFVDAVLSFSRTHADSITTTVAERRQTLLREALFMLREYGPRYFAADELRELEAGYLRRYYRILVRTAATRPNRAFFRYHLDGLRKAGSMPGPGQLAAAVVSEAFDCIARPARMWGHLRNTLRG
jgi:glycosyltransferase involved in cell wall biosynthesis